MIYLDKKYWIAVLCKIAMILSSFLVSIFINRGLGVTAKGEYAYVINLVEMLCILGCVGLGQTYSTFLKKAPHTSFSNRNVFTSLSFLHGIIILLLGCIVTHIVNSSYGMIVTCLTALATVKFNLSMIAVIEESIKRNVIQAEVNLIYFVGLMFLYFTENCSLAVVLFCYGLNELLRIFMLMKAYHLKPGHCTISPKVLKEIYSVGLLTMVVVLLISVNYSVDTIMLRHMTNNYQVGIYSVAVTFSNMFLLIPDAFKEVLLGDSTKKTFSKEAAFAPIKISVIISGFILIVFLFVGKFAIYILYGVDYLPSYSLTLILFCGSLSMIFFKILHPIYISSGQQIKVTLFLIGSAVTNVVANLILIPRLESAGAAIASAISYTTCGLLFVFDYTHPFKNKLNYDKAH